MSGGCLIERCGRQPEEGQVMCRWHASQTPPALYADLMSAHTTKTRATWGLGIFQFSTKCTRETAADAFERAVKAVRDYWAGGLVR